MTELFSGGELEAFFPSDNNSIESSGGAGDRYNPNFARCYIGVTGINSYIETAHWTAEDEAYHHWEIGLSQASFFTFDILVLYDASDDPVVRLRATRVDSTNHTLTLQYGDGMGGWVTADTLTIGVTLQTFDLHWKIDASGELDLYIAGTNRMSFAGDLSALGDVAYARHYGGFVTAYYSQVFTDTAPTIGERLYTIPPTSAGATSSWTGTYANIDEIAYSDADFINSGSANQVSTFGVTAPTLTGYTVKSVTVSARAKTDGGGPTQVQLALRSSGTDYFSSSKALDVGYGPFQNCWATDPATSSAWVNAAVASLQPGAKSIA